MHGHQHTFTEIYIHACIHEFIHKNKPPIITSTTDKGENDIHSFIQSGYFYSVSLVHYYSEALPTTVIDSVGVYTTKRCRQPYTVYRPTVYNIYYILLVKDLPKVPGVAARKGFEPTTLIPIQKHRLNQCATTPLFIGRA